LPTFAAQARPQPWSPAGAAALVFGMARRIESIPLTIVRAAGLEAPKCQTMSDCFRAAAPSSCPRPSLRCVPQR